MPKKGRNHYAPGRKNAPRSHCCCGEPEGGVGKTTTAVHLAASLGERGRKCLIWDLDMNCGSTRHFGIPAEMPILGCAEVLTGAEEPLDVIVSNGELEGIELPENVNLLPARRNLESIDATLTVRYKFGNPKDILRPIVDSLRPHFDYIFLDTAPNLTIPTVAAYKAADYFLLTAIPEPLAVDGLRDALDDIVTVRKQGNSSLRLIGVVMSAIKGRITRVQRELLNYIEKTFDRGSDPFIRSYRATISETTYICEVQKLGRTMFQVYPTHKVTEQYRELAREFEARLDALEKGQPIEDAPAEAGKEVMNG
jgi:chromosome partitioning protein